MRLPEKILFILFAQGGEMSGVESDDANWESIPRFKTGLPSWTVLLDGHASIT